MKKLLIILFALITLVSCEVPYSVNISDVYYPTTYYSRPYFRPEPRVIIHPAPRPQIGHPGAPHISRPPQGGRHK